MRKIAFILSIILIGNAILGYLFQLSNQLICFTELALLSLGGFIFWLGLYQPLRRFSSNAFGKELILNTNLIKIGALGFAFVVLNFLFCYLFLRASMYALFGCVPPSGDLLIASLTNNLAGNILCYASLVFFIFHEKPTGIPKELMVAGPTSIPDQTIIADLPNHPISVPQKEYLILTDSKKIQTKVSLASVSHVEVQANCIIIHSQNRKFVKYQSLKSFHKSLPKNQFIRIHRSTVVNLNFIAAINKRPSGDGEVHLKNNFILRYSRSYKKALNSFLTKP